MGFELRGGHGWKLWTSRNTSSSCVNAILFWDIFNLFSRVTGVDKAIWSERQEQLTGTLRRFRVQAGLSQVEVARRLGVPQSFVSKYENGERRLDLIELEQVARALGTTLGLLVAAFESQPASACVHVGPIERT
jgi:predicted XRE-type DNA-binding protein